MSKERKPKEKKLYNVEIGDRLEALRKILGMTQAKLAEELGVSEDFYRKVENGEYGLTIDKILFLHENHHIDPTYLLTGKQPEFDIDRFIVNCSKEQRDHMLDVCYSYLQRFYRQNQE